MKNSFCKVIALGLAGFIAISQLAVSTDANAQSRVVRKAQIKNTTVKFKDGKKTLTRKIACFGNNAGTTKKVKKKIVFTSFANQQKALARIRRKSSSTIKSLRIIKLVRAAGNKKCRSLNTPPPTPKVGYLSLSKYDGPFGLEQAHVLYNRFGFSGKPQELQAAVNMGMDATIEKLLTRVPEPALEAEIKDMECDNWLKSDPASGTNNRECNASNPNDIDRSGIVSGMMHRLIHTQNQFHSRLAFFLMDERLATSHSVAQDCERHALKTYVNSVYSAAYSGNYISYIRSMNSDHLMHLRWLDGATNRGGLFLGPNENYAREFWELGTVGTTALDGKPVYGDMDVAQAALAFTGWNINGQTINGSYICLSNFVPMFHTQGPKTVFIGTPYQSTVQTAEQLLQATINHPRFAEHLAEDIWKEFINPFAGPVEIQELAKLIRDNNYNLIPVFRQIMKSQAVHAPESKNSLIKHPLDIVVGYVRVTGFPLYYRSYNSLMGRLQQKLLDAPSVFGWNEKYLSGESLKMQWLTEILNIFMNINVNDLLDKHNWSYYKRFVLNLHNSGKASPINVINQMVSDLGIDLNEEQKGELVQLMNFTLVTSGCPGACSGMPYKLNNTPFVTDNTPAGPTLAGRKIRIVLAALIALPEYATK